MGVAALNRPIYAPLDYTDPLPFGKYKGRLAGEVADEDPNYLFWMLNNTDVRFVGSLQKYIEDEVGYRPGDVDR